VLAKCWKSLIYFARCDISVSEYKKADENEKLNIVDANTRPLRPLLISSAHRKKGRTNPHRKRPNRDPNIVTNYVASDNAETSNEPLLLEVHSRASSTHLSSRSDGIKDPSGVDGEKCQLSSQSHGYLTTSSIFSNPFHIPARKPTSPFHSAFTPSNAQKTVVELNQKDISTVPTRDVYFLQFLYFLSK